LYILAIPTCLFSSKWYKVTNPEHTKAEGITCSSPTWTWENPTPTGNTIYGISAVQNTDDVDVFAVGSGGTILQYSKNVQTQEAKWRPMISQTATNLKDVFALDHSNVWAVGESGKILKYNGFAWTEQTSGVTQTLNSVFAVDKNTIWAVGESGKILKYQQEKMKYMIIT
jgi:photosystem II stability/assembly factor-like uncharacterized protein